MVPANWNVLSGMGFSQVHRCGGDFRRMKNNSCVQFENLYQEVTSWNGINSQPNGVNYVGCFQCTFGLWHATYLPMFSRVCEYQKSAQTQEWQLTRQEYHQTVETEVLGWDGRNYWSGNIFFSLGWRKKNYPSGRQVYIVHVCMQYICIQYLRKTETGYSLIHQYQQYQWDMSINMWLFSLTKTEIEWHRPIGQLAAQTAQRCFVQRGLHRSRVGTRQYSMNLTHSWESSGSIIVTSLWPNPGIMVNVTRIIPEWSNFRSDGPSAKRCEDRWPNFRLEEYGDGSKPIITIFLDVHPFTTYFVYPVY